jgi:hypothetical protein
MRILAIAEVGDKTGGAIDRGSTVLMDEVLIIIWVFFVSIGILY